MSKLQLPPLPDLLAALIAGGYVIQRKDKYIFSAEFYKEITGVRQGLMKTRSGELVVVEPKLPLATQNLLPALPTTDTNWDFLFIEFIKKAEVPARLEDGRGNPYYANKYSADALKVFKRALEKEGVNLDLLVKSTKLYYKSSVRYKKAIGNYIKDGDWKTDYNNLLDSAQEGQESLTKHIKDQTDAPYTGYSLG